MNELEKIQDDFTESFLMVCDITRERCKKDLGWTDDEYITALSNWFVRMGEKIGAKYCTRTAVEWLQTPEFMNVQVLDPDGWDRKNFEESWAEKITKAEFENRLAKSTTIVRHRVLTGAESTLIEAALSWNFYRNAAQHGPILKETLETELEHLGEACDELESECAPDAWRGL